ncbi:MAG: hypothetical protein KGJ88_03620 [Verrucomicrobiota bacterium]|nr:hypothetical protein [Verrucomicrobiota bacterium]
MDSCIAPDGRTPAGLAYLKRLGVDASTSVKRVVATHWHQDHVRGLAQTVSACSSAKFICSQALWSKEFVTLTDLWKKTGLPSSPVNELSQVIETLARSAEALKGGEGEYPFGFAAHNQCLWRRRAVSDTSHDTSAELHSLSPSDAAIKKSLEMIASLFPAGEILTRPIPQRPNLFSVVLWLRVGDIRMLLGADMEQKGNPFGGWKLIVESSERPDGKASLFKIPHHGSETGEYGAVWTEMLISEPVAMLAPFNLGRVKLPTEKDAQRILGRTKCSFITADFNDRSSRGRTGIVNRMIHRTVRYIKNVNASFGQVRARKKIIPASGNWMVDVFGDAKPLGNLFAGKRA